MTTHDLDALATKTQFFPASCLECGCVVCAATTIGGVLIQPPGPAWQALLSAETVAGWEATQGLGMSERLSGLGHECRPYVVGSPIETQESNA